jgi:ubiquinone/menaquinone biosynthesis C-methylase UbiE
MPTPPLTPLAAAVLRVVPAPERVLEVECGEGEATLFLAREFPTARVRGVDSSATRIRAATARVGLDPEGRVAFKQGKPSALPFPEAFFNLVVVIDARPAVAELARVLAPGGWLLLVDSRRQQGPGGLAGWLLQRRLARRGLGPLLTESAGDGSFSVARHDDPGPAPRGD